MVSEVNAVDGDSKHGAGSFPVSVPQFLLIKRNYHWGSFNSKLNMETLSLLSRHIPICLPNERANPASCSELWWGMAVRAQGMTDSQRVSSPIIDHVHRVGVTTRRLSTPDASRSGKERGMESSVRWVLLWVPAHFLVSGWKDLVVHLAWQNPGRTELIKI